MEVASGEHGECVEKLVTAVNNGKCNNYQHYQAITMAQAIANDIAKRSPATANEQTKPETTVMVPNGVAKGPGNTVLNMPVSCTTSLLNSSESIEQKVGFPTNGWIQFWILLKRTFLSQIRDMVRKLFNDAQKGTQFSINNHSKLLESREFKDGISMVFRL